MLLYRVPVGVVGRRRRSQQEIAERLNWSKPTVGKWRQRFVEHRLQGIYDELRPGRPRSVSDEQVAVLLRRTLSRSPREQPIGAFGSPRRRTAYQVYGPSFFQLFSLHRTGARLQASTDPSRRKGARRVGLYLNPPDHAVVLSVDEKSQFKR